MNAPLCYCPACGAANAPEQGICHACAQPFTPKDTPQDQVSLLHGRYQVQMQVGTGGYGAVYKALDTLNQNQPVAIKQINLRGLTAQQIIEATDGFHREVQMLSALTHPHLPRIHAHFTDTEHWYIVMDFIAGETLEHYLHATATSVDHAIRELPLDEILDLGLQLCDVLAYLHSRQPAIIFRDLKPANLMRTATGQLYLIDFGIARFFKPGQTRDTSPLGSPGYAAPEQYGRAQTTTRSDVYSLGVLFHHLLSRRDPSEVPFSLSPLRSNGPTGQRELAALVTRMTELDAARRPAHMTEVREELLVIRQTRANEVRIWRPAPGQPPPMFAPFALASAHPNQRQQHIMQTASPRKKRSRRAFLIGGLATASTLALSGLGGFAYWSYWHPSRLTLEKGFPLQVFTPESDVSTIAWSPGGQRIAFGLSDGRIIGANLLQRSGIPFQFTAPFTLSADTPGQPISLMAWSGDQAHLAAISQTGQVQIWDIERRQTMTIDVSTTAIRTLAWTPNGQNIAVIYDPGNLAIYNGQNGKALFRQDNPTAGMLEPGVLAWAPDGSRFSTMSTPGNASFHQFELRDGDNGQVIKAAEMNGNEIVSVAWSPDGQYIATLEVNGTLQVWGSTNISSSIFSQELSTQQQQLAWSPDSRFLAVLDDSNNLLLLDRSSGQTLTSTQLDDPSGRGSVFPGCALTWLTDNQHIAVVSNNTECWLLSLPWW